MKTVACLVIWRTNSFLENKVILTTFNDHLEMKVFQHEKVSSSYIFIPEPNCRLFVFLCFLYVGSYNLFLQSKPFCNNRKNSLDQSSLNSTFPDETSQSLRLSIFLFVYRCSRAIAQEYVSKNPRNQWGRLQDSRKVGRSWANHSCRPSQGGSGIQRSDEGQPEVWQKSPESTSQVWAGQMLQDPGPEGSGSIC